MPPAYLSCLPSTIYFCRKPAYVPWNWSPAVQLSQHPHAFCFLRDVLCLLDLPEATCSISWRTFPSKGSNYWKKNLLQAVMYRIATSGWRNPRPRTGWKHPGISTLCFFSPNTWKKINPRSMSLHSFPLSMSKARSSLSGGCLQWQFGLLSSSTCFRSSSFLC